MDRSCRVSGLGRLSHECIFKDQNNIGFLHNLILICCVFRLVITELQCGSFEISHIQFWLFYFFLLHFLWWDFERFKFKLYFRCWPKKNLKPYFWPQFSENGLIFEIKWQFSENSLILKIKWQFSENGLILKIKWPFL